MGLQRYRVYFTPILSPDDNTYDAEIDVTEYILAAGVGNIRRSIDSSEYDVGVFTFSDLELTAYNKNGIFNENDTRSIFYNGRDRCKVRAVFSEIEMVRDSEGTVLSETEVSTVTFRGLINEEATRLDITGHKIRFKVLSRDSVLRTTQISAGVVTTGMTFTDTFAAILNVPKITSVLTFDLAEINPDLDLTVDDGSWFDNRGVKEALDSLLLASNSALLIADDGTMSVRSREQDETVDPLVLYGPYDVHRRENIIDITEYNSGKHRMFTSFVVNDQEVSDSVYVQAFGFRRKSVNIDFMTDATKETAIANRLVGEWKSPKIEVSVKVPTKLARDVRLLDRVMIVHPLRTVPPEGKFLPVVGVTEIGDAMEPLPEVSGSVEIPSRIRFKVLEVEDSVESFTSILRLRQTGRETGDGYFDTPNNCIVGFAIVGVAEICVGGDACDTYNPATIGGAQVGCTFVA